MTAPGEELVALHLARAWNEWCGLDDKQPEDDAEFRLAIHALQGLLAIRIARRVDPDVWGQMADRPSRDTAGSPPG